MNNKKIGLLSLCLFIVIVMAGCSAKKSNIEIERKIAEGENAIAMITDAGSISDYSFNQTTYEACSKFAQENDITFIVKKPRENTDEAREEMTRIAVEEGYNIIVLPGYSFTSTVKNCSFDYPDVKFIALDVSAEDLSGEYNKDNCYIITYKEEVAGFMAGYAAVEMGYHKLGFVGGVENPAVIRYGYGFLSGINAAAKEKNLQNEVEVSYTYTGTFSPNAEIAELCRNWYSKGTEVIFACGGGIYSSVAEASSKYYGKMIGVDVDQSEIINEYRDDMVITSATKGLGPSTTDAIKAIIEGKWSEKSGKIVKLGLVSYEKPELNYVQLPETTQWTDEFDEASYKELIKSIMDGKYIINDQIDSAPSVEIKVDYEILEKE